MKNEKDKILNEQRVIKYLKIYLKKEGWNVLNDKQRINEGGCDVIARKPRWNKYFYIEAKGDGKRPIQMRQNAFATVIGQIVCRMSIEGNIPNSARTYAIAFPAEWKNLYRRKVSNMKYAWKKLNLNVFLVSKNGKVERLTSRQFIR